MRRQGDNPFLISISDLMTGLFMVVMFALIAMTTSLSESKAGHEREKRIKEMMAKDIKNALPQKMAGVFSVKDLSLKWREAWFDEDRALLKENAKKMIEKEAVPYLEIALSDTYNGFVKFIFVRGHTTSKTSLRYYHMGCYKGNLKLSQNRAEAIAYYLDDKFGDTTNLRYKPLKIFGKNNQYLNEPYKRFGVTKFQKRFRKKLAAVGRSFSEPAIDSETDKPLDSQNEQNRRVELRIELYSYNEIIEKEDLMNNPLWKQVSDE